MNTMKRILGLFIFLLCWNVGMSQDYTLKNDVAELVFEGGSKFLFKSFTMDGINILPAEGSKTVLWKVNYLGSNGENPEILPQWTIFKGTDTEVTKNETSLIFTWNVILDADSFPLKVKVTLGKGNKLPEWRLYSDMPKNWVVTKITFPQISVKRAENTKAILPIGFGSEYSVGKESQLSSRYPSGTGNMQFVMAYNNDGTIFYSAFDKEASGKQFSIKGEGNNMTFIQEVITSYAWSENSHFSLPWPVVMGFSKDNWQNTAVKWYRPFTFETPWGNKTITERNIVEWIKNADLWLRPANVSDSTMKDLRKALKLYGKGVGLHWYYWHKYPFDTHYPDYFPEQDGFKSMIKECQKLGAYITPYINGRLWDPSTTSYKEKGVAASCRKADGSLYSEIYGSKVINTVTCPASTIWQKTLSDVNEQILRELKTDGVYMDQIGCANSEPCYATNHNHAKGGGSWWPTAYRNTLQKMRGEFYSTKQAMTTEENAECYIDVFDMMLVVNAPHQSYVKMVPLFPLIYADRCIYSGFTYVPWDLNNGAFSYMSAKSLIWGSQLGWVNPNLLMLPQNSKVANFLKALADFRKGQHDLFVGGRFINEITLGGDNPSRNIPEFGSNKEVLCAEWKSVNGVSSYIIVNMGKQDHKIVMPNGKGVSIKAMSVVRINK